MHLLVLVLSGAVLALVLKVAFACRGIEAVDIEYEYRFAEYEYEYEVLQGLLALYIAETIPDSESRHV